ncbi:MAG: hypothetical protein ACR2N3_16970 [Pyrinomonadaceae bacterium]
MFGAFDFIDYWRAVYEKVNYFCPQCRQTRVFTRRGTNHWHQFSLSVATFGLWLPAWAFIAIRNSSRPFTCSICKYTDYGRILAMSNSYQQR